MSSTTAAAPAPAGKQHGGGGGCCSSGMTLELVGAFTAVCLVLYGVILYFNYLYMRWSGGVHRSTGGGGGAGAARKRGGGGGLDKAALAAIPVFTFDAAAAAREEAEAECAVCLSGMQEGEAVRALPGCGHAFHAACVDAWLRAHATCPVCRARPAVPTATATTAKCFPKSAAAAADRQPDLESQV
uniref:RING-type E3 ubiquitin transferase n=1 Tax=Leersia perrieri TaxID=77586 RepID=A0A0D9VEA1_9ORYZ